MSVSLSISLLFQISERKWGGTWSHESCGVCNSCEGGNYINSVYMLVGCSGLNSNCSSTRLHSYFVSPAGMDDFSCGWAGRRSGWGWGMPWSRVLWLLWPGLGLWLWQISSIWIKSSALYAAGSKVMCHCWGVISPYLEAHWAETDGIYCTMQGNSWYATAVTFFKYIQLFSKILTKHE